MKKEELESCIEAVRKRHEERKPFIAACRLTLERSMRDTKSMESNLSNRWICLLLDNPVNAKTLATLENNIIIDCEFFGYAD